MVTNKGFSNRMISGPAGTPGAAAGAPGAIAYGLCLGNSPERSRVPAPLRPILELVGWGRAKVLRCRRSRRGPPAVEAREEEHWMLHINGLDDEAVAGRSDAGQTLAISALKPRKLTMYGETVPHAVVVLVNWT